MLTEPGRGQTIEVRYRIYWNGLTADYFIRLDVDEWTNAGDSLKTVYYQALKSGKEWIYMTAIDAAGNESVPSESVYYEVKMAGPYGVEIIVTGE